MAPGTIGIAAKRRKERKKKTPKRLTNCSGSAAANRRQQKSKAGERCLGLHVSMVPFLRFLRLFAAIPIIESFIE
jgi:hypothetical protein